MGITHEEFFRLLPAAVTGLEFQVDGDTVHVSDGGGRLLIRLGSQGERVIGALRIPTTRVSFAFHGYTDQALQTFMAYFDSRFQRGGG
jgi:hypothetical protein